jgi:hypothetical protein
MQFVLEQNDEENIKALTKLKDKTLEQLHRPNSLVS